MTSEFLELVFKMDGKSDVLLTIFFLSEQMVRILSMTKKNKMPERLTNPAHTGPFHSSSSRDSVPEQLLESTSDE